jgi:tRNA threonylcarbamoyl adenosine modification protein YeaZ
MFLILDFTQSLRLAIINNNKTISKEIKTKKNISEILIIEIDKFLKKSKTNFKTIKSICVITGPGSFTGIRSALTFAKSLKLTTKLDIFGISKFEIINSQFKSNKYNKKKCILLHFKDKQFFLQTFKEHKAIEKAKLLDLDNVELRFNDKTTYIYDNILFRDLLENTVKASIKKNFHLIDYNLDGLREIIIKNAIDNSEPKPLYITNYY